jgi:hypothetical protein
MQFYDKRDDYNFPIVNFPLICSNIQAAHVHGVYYISVDTVFHYYFFDTGVTATVAIMTWLTAMEYGLQICSICRIVTIQFSFSLSWLVTVFLTRVTHRVQLQWSRNCIPFPSSQHHPCFFPHFAQSLVFCIVFCRSLFVNILYCIVCPSNNLLWK